MSRHITTITAGCIFFMLSPLLTAKTVVDLQPFRGAAVDTWQDARGRSGEVRLIQLNKNIHDWYLVSIRWPGYRHPQNFHLENPFPEEQRITLAEGQGGIFLSTAMATNLCRLWGEGRQQSALVKAGRARRAYAPLCDGRLFVRNKTLGNTTTKEWAVDFLRDNVWGGEAIISFLKDTVFRDSELVRADDLAASAGVMPPDGRDRPNLPFPAHVHPQARQKHFRPGKLGITFKGSPTLQIGRWYRSELNPGAYVSVIQPGLIAPEILASYPDRVKRFDAVERDAMAYLVAFDMTGLEIGYALGTDHPEVAYSERANRYQRQPGWPGPDGIGDFQPLQSTGVLNPLDARRAVATFTGGFKRKHSIFRWGAFAKQNGGTHYGFMQNGVIFSTLYNGLATVIIDKDGDFTIKTWTDADQDRLDEIRFARQNGRPLVEWDAAQDRPRPGRYVGNNAVGNWSGSKQNTIRALRTGMCLMERGTRRFLVYGYFTSHTPNALARTFQAYNCRYAIHLDMNMIVHTYLAIYKNPEDPEQLQIQHIDKDMHWKDKRYRGGVLPRFVAVPDNRDFFYLLRKRPRLSGSLAH